MPLSKIQDRRKLKMLRLRCSLKRLLNSNTKYSKTNISRIYGLFMVKSSKTSRIQEQKTDVDPGSTTKQNE